MKNCARSFALSGEMLAEVLPDRPVPGEIRGTTAEHTDFCQPFTEAWQA